MARIPIAHGPAAAVAWPSVDRGEGVLLRLLEETTGAAEAGCSAWLPDFRQSLELLDEIWAERDSALEGAATMQTIRLGQLCKSAFHCSAEVPGLRAALLRRLADHQRSARAALPAGDESFSRTVQDIFSSLVPTQEQALGRPALPAGAEGIPRLAAELFNAMADVTASLDRLPEPFAAPLEEALRLAAPHPLQGPVRVAVVLSLLVPELRAGRRFAEGPAKALLDLVLQVLRAGDRLGADTDETIGLAMRAAAWLAASHHDSQMVLDAVAVANARHDGRLVDVAASCWLEARRALDAKAVAGAAGDPSTRRQVRKERLAAGKPWESYGPPQADIEILQRR